MRLDAFTLIAILIILLIIIIYFAWMVRYNATAKERLLIIEKDFDMNKLLVTKKSSFTLLKGGIILVSSAIGAVVGLLSFSISSINEGVLFFISVFMFAGIGMIVANKVDQSKKEE
jgi:predicted ABC-type sugar transport system permease subunit